MIRGGVAAVAAVIAFAPAPALAQSARAYDIAEQDLAGALKAFAAVSGREIIAPSELIQGRRSGAVRGLFSPEEAARRLLVGTGLRLEIVEGAFVIRAGDGDEADPGSGSAIVVTGTRIRGAPVASPVVTMTQDQIRSAGQSTLAEAVRSIPQNFGGGQNPGVGNNVPATSGVNVGSSTSINLRGLGSDATLTLLNGHRLSYSASRQAIDVSSIPLGAIDRIEIVPDGASALYGSDAVAGVANVILRRDFRGVETSARLGTSTDGGDFEQRYGVAAGTRWTSGGFIAAYEFGRTTPILGSERSYTASRSPALTLFPGMRNHSGTLSGHQNLTQDLHLSVDALYNNRFSQTSYALNAAGVITTSGVHIAYRSESFVIAPTLELALGGWRTFITGSYGQDHTHYDVTSYSAGIARNTPGNCYCNNARSVEAGADGKLFGIPSGPVRLALGAGYRANDFIRFNGVGAATNVSHAQDSYYGYGELSLPLVSPAQHVPLAYRFSLSAATRYEKYPGVGEVMTPKFGAIYGPSADFDIKGSWGKSFRAPTLYQQYQARNVVLAVPGTLGGSGYPADATAIVLQGGNANLKPERATTWSATFDLHPRAVPGARLELSYFSTQYRDRIVTPIAFLSQSLSNPLYASRLTPKPTGSFLADIIASAALFGNAAGVPYDPAKVAVFIDDSNVNAGRQSIHGADALLSYRIPLGGRAGTLSGSLNATYLVSEQQLGAGLPVTQLAGIIFNPPHYRARGGLGWERRGFTLTGTVSYIGGVSDTRKPTTVPVGSMTLLDLTARYRSRSGAGWLSDLDLVLSVQNVFNAKPAPIAVTLLSDAPYDSTNYSPVGRFVSFSVRKKW